MKDLLAQAEEYRAVAAAEAMAHQLSAEYHRKMHMRLGFLSTAVTALVGTGIFAGLLGQLGLDGKAPFAIPAGSLMWLYLVVALLALAAPVLTAIHTFMHNAEDAQRHTASEADYTAVVQQLERLALRFQDPISTSASTDEMRGQFEATMKEYSTARRNRLTMPKRAYDDADIELKRRRQSLNQVLQADVTSRCN